MKQICILIQHNKFQVSVIKKETSDQKQEDNPPSSPKHKHDEETVEVVANDDGKTSSTFFSSATETTNEDPADHLSLDKLLVDLKNSHNKLSKLNDVLQGKKTVISTTSSGNFEKVLNGNI